MYSCQIKTESNECVKFEEYYTLFGLFMVKPPPHTEWWGWDANLGSGKYMISMRQSVNERPEYMIWKCFNNTNLSTSQVVLSSNDLPNDIPIRYIVVWATGFITDLIMRNINEK